MAKEPMTAEEKRWQAQQDAHALSESEAVKADPARLQAAKLEAQRLVEHEKEKTKAMQKVAGKEPIEDTSTQPPKMFYDQR